MAQNQDYKGISSKSLEYLVNHVVLPPKVPQSEEENAVSDDSMLLSYLCQISSRFTEFLLPNEANRVIKQLNTMRDLHHPEADLPACLQTAITGLDHGDQFAFYVRSQNAGIIFRRVQDHLQFEVFEASPGPEAVVNCEGRLRIVYPGPATAIPWKIAENKAFLKELGAFLSHMNLEIFQNETLSKSRKGNNSLPESRDVPDPRYIIELLTGILRGMGTEINIDRITKHIRDEVNIKSAKNPWRRSALWLVTRVALQTNLSNPDYKCVMLEILRSLVDTSLDLDASSFHISCISKKLARRTNKLDEKLIPEKLLNEILKSTEMASQLLSGRWTKLTKSNHMIHWDKRVSTPKNIARNTALTMKKVGLWIDQRIAIYRGQSHVFEDAFVPVERTRNHDLWVFPATISGTEAQIATELVDFEKWVEKDMESWCSKSTNIDIVERLSENIENYHRNALAQYHKINILNTSRMFLTILEMWVEIDKAVCKVMPLLVHYSPEIPRNILEPILLIEDQDMVRTSRVREYLVLRHASCIQSRPSIYDQTALSNSFAINHYDESPILQDLRTRIEDAANAEKAAKRCELKKKIAQYNNLVSKAEKREHEYGVSRKGYPYHDRYCQRCRLEKELKQISIDVFEWPLPSGINELKSVIFELQPPNEFAIWRDITFYIMTKVALTNENALTSGNQESYDLNSWSILGRNRSFRLRRITLSSTAKPIARRSHYSRFQIPASEDSVLVNHGGRYRLFNSRDNEYIERQHKGCTVATFCQSNLSYTPYAQLAYAVNRTDHTHNKVIAEQQKCPATITLREYESFASLRSGSRLQWQNMLIELRKTDLTFKNESVYRLFLHAACQVGKPSDGFDGSGSLWESHVDLSQKEFCEELLKTLSESLSVLEDNWEQANSLKTLILLAYRIATCGHESVQESVLDFLRKARAVCHPWIQSLQEKLQRAEDDSMTQYFRHWLLRIAGIQHSTFNAGRSLIAHTLKDPHDITEYLVCQNLIQDNCMGALSKLPTDLRFLLEECRRFAIHTEILVHESIQKNNAILSRTVNLISAALEVAGTWEQLNRPAERWWRIVSVESSTYKSRIIHFDVLQGRLLINGQPNGRLPEQYFNHEQYSKLLGGRIFDVIPSNIPNMTYQTKNKFNGIDLHFHLDATSLIVRKAVGDKLYEHIPSRHFDGDIPKPLYRAGSQWLDLKTTQVWFYSSKLWWKDPCTEQHWMLSRDPFDQWTLVKDNVNLLEIGGDIHRAVARTLSPIEEFDQILTTKNDENVIEIYLPRYELQFFVNEQNLYECKSIKGLVLDKDQNFGTFVGLKSFLKLREERDYFEKECVLVPYGKINSEFSESENHTKVLIVPPAGERKYTIFTIDKPLNRLLDDGTLKARYTRIYLHALTSGILPDPLIGHTGKREAINGLKSSASFSFQNLGDQEADLLKTIANLAPGRSFYPRNHKKMQETFWNDNFPPWIQIDDFSILANEIMTHWNRFCFSIDGAHPRKLEARGSPELLRRARYSESTFRNGDPEISNRQEASRLHMSRHAITDREKDVCDLSSILHHWEPRADLQVDISSVLMPLQTLDGPFNVSPISYTWDCHNICPVQSWCTLYHQCRDLEQRHKFGISFAFGAIVYRSPKMIKILKSLVAVAISNDFKTLLTPSYKSFSPSIGTQPRRETIMNLLGSSVNAYENSNFFRLPRLTWESDAEYNKRRYTGFEEELKEQRNLATTEILNQWPKMYAESPGRCFSLLNVSDAIDDISSHFEICYRNMLLSKHLDQVAGKLKIYNYKVIGVGYFDKSTLGHSKRQETIQRSEDPLRVLMRERPSMISGDLPSMIPFVLTTPSNSSKNEESNSVIQSLAHNLRQSEHPFSSEYAASLLQSCAALSDHGSVNPLTRIPGRTSDFKLHERLASENSKMMLSQLVGALSPVTKSQVVQWQTGLWPSITKRRLIQHLQLEYRSKVPKSWRKAIIKLVEVITWEQRATRLVRFAFEGKTHEFELEASNPGRQNWDSDELIDWLLFEADADMLIRPVQASIGSCMMDERENNSAVMQLNMGEGKSAVIVPIVSAALADRKKLVRVVVLKPLSTQMFHILAQRLGELCNRRIYYLPFHRGLTLSTQIIDNIRSLYQECMDNGGIFLTLPEHILSFKLMGVEKMIQDDNAISKPIEEAQKWLSTNTRDILDESDEILHIRYQLIYTIGEQETLEGGDCRWKIIQEILSVVQEKAVNLSHLNPESLEIGPNQPNNHDSYRNIRFIDEGASKKLLQDIAYDICFGGSDVLPSISPRLKLLPRSIRELAMRFISLKDVSTQDQATLLSHCSDLTHQFLILRGLIADGVLFFVLHDKRYRVDYGLDRKRTNLAVPYRAKDRPALKAEFGHPEVVLALTCLSYYYGGLEDEDLQSCFEELLKSNCRDLTYEAWVDIARRHVPVPPSLSKIEGLNLLDKDQVTKEIFPFFRFNKGVIDFFLSHLIFPREAKGFPFKLSTSGWDLAEQKINNTTGFSGTNDNRYLLPTSIKQLDLPGQSHTNSLVLRNILRTENKDVIEAKNQANGGRLDANQMLRVLSDEHFDVQVLLDVGAQILELTNKQVAETWLNHCQIDHILGAVFFGDDDELLVMTKDRKIESFMSSPLSKQLERTLVYLDEAHTRGTDLKLPVNSKAAVTLGPNLAKDKFVQGCMRMRKLGRGHSLNFWAPPDIYTAIRKCSGKPISEAIDNSDVVLWTMIESCRQVQHGFSVWADQGLQYLKRKNVWDKFQKDSNRERLRLDIQDKETRPLMEMYGINDEISKLGEGVPDSLHKRRIFENLSKHLVSNIRNVAVQEEQEREVDHEIEEETNIERPNFAKPREHELSPVIIRMVRTGEFLHDTSALDYAYCIFARTSAKNLFRLSDWKHNIFATTDFMQTINTGSTTNLDDFIRPVKWIMRLRNDPRLILLSPFEADSLIPNFRRSKNSSLHCYAPRVTKGMQSFDLLDFCPVGQSCQYETPLAPSFNTRLLLNLFAGALFFEDLDYYHRLLDYLGLCYDEIDSTTNRGNDGWIDLQTRQAVGVLKAASHDLPDFQKSPLPFLEECIRMRRKGQGFALTHMGAIFNSRNLEEREF